MTLPKYYVTTYGRSDGGSVLMEFAVEGFVSFRDGAIEFSDENAVALFVFSPDNWMAVRRADQRWLTLKGEVAK